MTSSATKEINSLAWCIARCREGLCRPADIPPKQKERVLVQCMRDMLPHGETLPEGKELGEDVLLQELRETCARNPLP